jgi:hypothetical protein
MKFAFALWITILGAFDASVWATAMWCILGYFTDVSWLQWFGICIPIRFIWNLFSANSVNIHTKQDFLFRIRLELLSAGIASFFAVTTSIIPTIPAIALLSLLEVWTNLKTHWFHTWLFVACAVYIFTKAESKRQLAARKVARTAQKDVIRPCSVRVIDV